MNFYMRPTTTRTQRKLRDFADLPVGWHYGEGGPISAEVISRAEYLYDVLLYRGLTRTDAFAGASGEILLTAYRGDHYLGMLIEPDGSYGVVHEVTGGEDDEPLEGLDLGDLKKRLGEIADSIWNTSGSSTRAISTPFAANLTTSLSSGRLTAGCPYSSSTAQTQPVAA